MKKLLTILLIFSTNTYGALNFYSFEASPYSEEILITNDINNQEARFLSDSAYISRLGYHSIWTSLIETELSIGMGRVNYEIESTVVEEIEPTFIVEPTLLAIFNFSSKWDIATGASYSKKLFLLPIVMEDEPPRIKNQTRWNPEFLIRFRYNWSLTKKLRFKPFLAAVFSPPIDMEYRGYHEDMESKLGLNLGFETLYAFHKKYTASIIASIQHREYEFLNYKIEKNQIFLGTKIYLRL